jgi:hypothetical protein
MIRHYATVCRETQVDVLFSSMERHCGAFVLHVLAWDWEPRSVGPGVAVVRRETFLARHPDYAPERMPGAPRSPINSAVTARWRFFADLVADLGQPLTTLDGDIWFWSSPEPMFEEIGAARLAVSPHRIPPAKWGRPGATFETHRKYGLYNTGFVYLADPAIADELAALNLGWSDTVLRRLPEGRVVFGDQGWLELVVEKHGAHVIEHLGVNVAPWNVHAHSFERRDDGQIYVGGQPLVCYHYSSLHLGPDGSVGQFADPGYAITVGQTQIFYEPYLSVLRAGR